MPPGRVLHREFEDERHATRSFSVNFDGASGRVGPIASGSTRNQADFRAPIRATVDAQPRVGQGPFVGANLNPHPSEALVRSVAEESDLDIDRGVKGKSGRLGSIETRAPFLSDPTHRLVLHDTPQHASWMNPVEIWFSLLARKLLKRGSFISVGDLKTKGLALVEYFNRTMAKPFRWTDQGKPLVA
jgi:hypothetical protein